MVSGLVGNPDFALYLQQVHFLNLPQKRVPKCYKTNPPKPKNPGKSTFSPKTPPNRRNPQTKTRTRSTSLRDTSPKVPNNPQKHQIPSDGTQGPSETRTPLSAPTPPPTHKTLNTEQHRGATDDIWKEEAEKEEHTTTSTT